MEAVVLWSSDVRKKAKKWHDGSLIIDSDGQATLKDDTGAVITRLKQFSMDALKDGDGVSFGNKFLVQLDVVPQNTSNTTTSSYKSSGKRKRVTLKPTFLRHQPTQSIVQTAETTTSNEMKTPLESTQAANSEAKMESCMYTSDLTKKNKVWHDGFLRRGETKLTLLDGDQRQVLDSMLISRLARQAQDDLLRFDRYLVECLAGTSEKGIHGNEKAPVVKMSRKRLKVSLKPRIESPIPEQSEQPASHLVETTFHQPEFVPTSTRKSSAVRSSADLIALIRNKKTTGTFFSGRTTLMQTQPAKPMRQLDLISCKQLGTISEEPDLCPIQPQPVPLTSKQLVPAKQAQSRLKLTTKRAERKANFMLQRRLLELSTSQLSEYRLHGIPTTFEDSATYFAAVHNTTVECLQIAISAKLAHVPFSQLTNDNDRAQAELKTKLSKMGIKIYFGGRVGTLNYGPTANYYIYPDCLDHPNTYSKDDIWLIIPFEQNQPGGKSKALLVRSMWYAPNNEGGIQVGTVHSESQENRLMEFAGQSPFGRDVDENDGLVLPSRRRGSGGSLNSRSNAKGRKFDGEFVFVRLMNAGSELVVLDQLRLLRTQGEEMLNTVFPLCSWIINPCVSHTQHSIGAVINPVLKKKCLDVMRTMCETFTLNEDQRRVVHHFIHGLFHPFNQAPSDGRNDGLEDREYQDALAPVTLCHGVFGAGKSYLLVSLILLLWEVQSLMDDYYYEQEDALGDPYVKQLRVLVSSNTNVAVDRIMVSLKEREFESMLRVGPLKKMNKQILPWSLQARQAANGQEGDVGELEKMLKSGELDDDLEWELRRVMRGKAQEIGGLGDQAAGESRNNRSSRPGTKPSPLEEAFVVGSTCLSTATSSAFLGAGTGEVPEFPIVILDECSQMTEALSLLPLGRFRCQRVILIGDPLQLPPTLPSTRCSPPADPKQKGGLYGCERTLFERLSDAGIQPIQLRTQFRCHPMISQLANTLFYERRLLDGIEPHDRSFIRQLGPLSFISMPSGGKEVQSRGGSYVNHEECDAIVQLVRYLLGLNVVSESEIGVISLYKNQVDLIRSRLTNILPASDDPDESSPQDKSGGITVSTVDAFQGAERKVIILSTVRANGRTVGFTHDPRRMNVALTRAKCHLVLVGHERTLDKSELWRKVMDYCRTKGKVVSSVEELFQ